MSLTIVRLYHDLLGTYGDQGNAEILIHRAMGRNLDGFQSPSTLAGRRDLVE